MLTVRLIAHTPDPEKVVAAAAKLCYSKADIDTIMDGLTDEKVTKFLNSLVERGHMSPFEHASFTFGIEDVSRSFLAQISRHRIASFSVQSQRYVHDNFGAVIPEAIKENVECNDIYKQTIESLYNIYDGLTETLQNQYISDGMDAKAEEVVPKFFGTEEQRKRWLKIKYIKSPLFIRPFINFFIRYILKGGFLDGKEGFVWHILQGFWYRMLVDAKIFEIKKKFNSNPEAIKEFLKDYLACS